MLLILSLLLIGHGCYLFIRRKFTNALQTIFVVIEMMVGIFFAILWLCE